LHFRTIFFYKKRAWDIPTLQSFTQIPSIPEQNSTLRWTALVPITYFFGQPTVILDYYGGYDTKLFKKTSEQRLNLYPTFPTFFKEEGILRKTDKAFVVETEDSNLSIFQGRQFDFQDKKGRELLIKTTLDFLHFAHRVKQTYPDDKLVYNGASFGGAKGAFIHFLLSNKEDLGRFLPTYVATPLSKGMADIPSSLFDGFILHASGFRYLDFLNNSNPRFSTPMILSHNFDDHRVDAKETLEFFARHGRRNKTMFLHICPQGALSEIQKKDGEASSLEGHGYPHQPELYLPFMYKRKQFLDFISQKSSKVESELRKDSMRDCDLYRLLLKKRRYEQRLSAHLNFLGVLNPLGIERHKYPLKLLTSFSANHSSTSTGTQLLDDCLFSFLTKGYNPFYFERFNESELKP
jgi:hypothetical protein